MSNSVLAGIDLGDSAVWKNEFEGSAISREIKHTEDGRKVIFHKTEQKNKPLIIACGWQAYRDIKVFDALKNAGLPTVLTLADGRVFNVLIESTMTAPITESAEFTEYEETDLLDLTLTLLEI